MRHAHRAVLAALAVLVALSAAAAVGCGGRGDASQPAGTAPSGAADITGVVRTLSLSPDDGSAVMLLVADPADPAVPGVVDRAMVRVAADARIWAQDGDGRRALSIADLAVGQLVAVWFSGPVAESYPVQADAGDVEVLSPPED